MCRLCVSVFTAVCQEHGPMRFFHKVLSCPGTLASVPFFSLDRCWILALQGAIHRSYFSFFSLCSSWFRKILTWIILLLLLALSFLLLRSILMRSEENPLSYHFYEFALDSIHSFTLGVWLSLGRCEQMPFLPGEGTLRDQSNVPLEVQLGESIRLLRLVYGACVRGTYRSMDESKANISP